MLLVYLIICYEVIELFGCSVLDGLLFFFKKGEILKIVDCYKEEI